jgi:hypothetical protein
LKPSSVSFFHIYDVQIFSKFASKIAKLVEITLENDIVLNFLDLFVQKGIIHSQKNNVYEVYGKEKQCL